MGIQQIPLASGGGIKLVQRGQAVSAGNITITAVDTTKTFVRSFSEGASGTVATNSTVASHSSTVPQHQLGVATNIWSTTTHHTRFGNSSNPDNIPSGLNTSQSVGVVPSYNISNPSVSMSGGTMDATTKQFGVHLANSTTLTATGACRYEVVEFA